MKTNALFLFFILSTFYIKGISQNKNDSLQKKWSIGLQINTPERQNPYFDEHYNTLWEDGYLYLGSGLHGITKDRTLSFSLLADYYSKGNNFFRIQTRINRVNIQLVDVEPGQYGTAINENASKYRTDAEILYGFAHKIQMNHIIFYAGVDLEYTHYGAAKVHYYYEIDSLTNGTRISSEEIRGTLFKSISIGFGNFAGLAYIFHRMNFGGEISYALLYDRRYSTSSFNIINTNFQTNNISSSTVSSAPTISSFDLSKIKAAITFTYNF